MITTQDIQVILCELRYTKALKYNEMGDVVGIHKGIKDISPKFTNDTIFTEGICNFNLHIEKYLTFNDNQQVVLRKRIPNLTKKDKQAVDEYGNLKYFERGKEVHDILNNNIFLKRKIEKNGELQGLIVAHGSPLIACWYANYLSNFLSGKVSKLNELSFSWSLKDMSEAVGKGFSKSEMSKGEDEHDISFSTLLTEDLTLEDTLDGAYLAISDLSIEVITEDLTKNDIKGLISTDLPPALMKELVEEVCKNLSKKQKNVLRLKLYLSEYDHIDDWRDNLKNKYSSHEVTVKELHHKFNIDSKNLRNDHRTLKDKISKAYDKVLKRYNIESLRLMLEEFIHWQTNKVKSIPVEDIPIKEIPIESMQSLQPTFMRINKVIFSTLTTKKLLNKYVYQTSKGRFDSGLWIQDQQLRGYKVQPEEGYVHVMCMNNVRYGTIGDVTGICEQEKERRIARIKG